MNAVSNLNLSTCIDNNVATRLDEIANEKPGLAALIQGSGNSRITISYSELAKKVARRAGVLKYHGIRKGDTVLMLQPMSIDFYVSVLAVFKIGATVLILDPAAGIQKVKNAISRVKPQAVIASGKGLVAAVTITAVRKIGMKLTTNFAPPGWRSLSVKTAKALTEPVDKEQPALITLTSGTSGASDTNGSRGTSGARGTSGTGGTSGTSRTGGTVKLIVRTHGFLKTQLQTVGANCDFKAGICELTTLPVFILANLASGVSSIMPDTDLSKASRLNTRKIAQQLLENKPSRILASPSFIERVMDYCESRGISLDWVETVITGGGPVFPRLMAKMKRVCPNANIVTVYGSTEAEPIAKIDFKDLTQAELNAIANGAGLPVGYTVPQVDIKILPLIDDDEQLRNRDRLCALRHICEISNLSLDAVGEILVRGDHVVKSYLNGIGDSETKMKIDGEIWHKTGDIGYLDRAGRLWLTGRKSSPESKLDTSFSQCMEAVALSDPTVLRAACFTIDDATKLFVETCARKNFDQWTVKNRLNWSGLDTVKLVRHIPCDTRHNSKVLYAKLASSF